MRFDTASPIWLQLVSEFQRRLVTGQWPPGERLPGVRDLAAQLGVNPNTVQRALAELERDGLCRTERTSGRFAVDDVARIAALRRELATQATDEFVNRAKGFGMKREEAAGLLEERWAHEDSDRHAATGIGG